LQTYDTGSELAYRAILQNWKLDAGCRLAVENAQTYNFEKSELGSVSHNRDAN